MEKMKELMKNKVVLGSIAGVLVLTLAIVAVCVGIRPKAKPTGKADSSGPSGNIYLQNGDSSNGVTDSSGNPVTTPSGVDVDVHGNPGSKPTVNTGGVAAGGNSGNPSGGSNAKKPGVNVTSKQDEPQNKPNSNTPSKPNGGSSGDNGGEWVPPPPGEGTGEVIEEGFETIKVSADKSISKAQKDVATMVTECLQTSGYSTIDWMPIDGIDKMANEAAKQYATTGKYSFNPSKYGLPKVVGSYALKLPVKGSSAREAGYAIGNYMKKDKAWNDKVKSTFNGYYRSGTAVYQHNGYFYVVFVSIKQTYDGLG